MIVFFNAALLESSRWFNKKFDINRKSHKNIYKSKFCGVQELLLFRAFVNIFPCNWFLKYFLAIQNFSFRGFSNWAKAEDLNIKQNKLFAFFLLFAPYNSPPHNEMFQPAILCRKEEFEVKKFPIAVNCVRWFPNEIPKSHEISSQCPHSGSILCLRIKRITKNSFRIPRFYLCFRLNIFE